MNLRDAAAVINECADILRASNDLSAKIDAAEAEHARLKEAGKSTEAGTSQRSVANERIANALSKVYALKREQDDLETIVVRGWTARA